MSALVAGCDDPVRYVAGELHSSEFAQLHDCAVSVLAEVAPAVRIALDTDSLRETQALSALAGGEQALPLPPTVKLHSRTTAPLHTALSHAHEYAEWAVYAGLVLPQTVFSSSAALELFSAVASELLVVDLTRGHSVNVHQELDRLKDW